MRPSAILVGAAFLLLLAGGAFWRGLAPAAAEPEADPEDAAQVALGRAVYAEACASCHGADLEGAADWRTPGPDGRLPPPPHDETGHTWHHGDQTLFDITKLGGAEALARQGVEGFDSGMPGFGDSLSDEEIWAALAYIKASWPEKIRAAQRSRDALAP